MKDDQTKRLIRIILVSWFLAVLAGIGIVTWATVRISQLENRYETLASKPIPAEKTVEKQLQPIYTTIAGEKGDKGDKGEDSLSTHTETVTVFKTETMVPGPKGDTGKRGSTGSDGRSVELGYDSNTQLWYQRFIGTEIWEPVPIISLDAE